MIADHQHGLAESQGDLGDIPRPKLCLSSSRKRCIRADPRDLSGRSKWTFSFFVDLKPYRQHLDRIQGKLVLTEMNLGQVIIERRKQNTYLRNSGLRAQVYRTRDPSTVGVEFKIEVYNIHNIPLPYPNNPRSKLTVKYELETDILAVNAERTQYMQLKAQDLNECYSVGTDSIFCSLRSPVYDFGQR